MTIWFNQFVIDQFKYIFFKKIHTKEFCTNTDAYIAIIIGKPPIGIVPLIIGKKASIFNSVILEELKK